ncbi:ABC transporter substrate-binding protein [Paenibacillus hamazuiensis]|uniref:ABC transporter substrate-binding protein n=1 Tax=Paenibacillus hamazuiensis TaxID=2936508 RepID=UPI00200EC06A|nr:ABC transporter substrate-binding protein [Paenibacillus hamazuiensis]
MFKNKLFIASALIISMLGLAACGSGGASNTAASGNTGVQADQKDGKKKDIVIGFSNSFNGNSYRQVMENYFKETADEMKKSGEISDYVIVEANNNINQQITQIENLILKKVSAIIVDPGSGTALDGAIAKATAAGIPVIVVNDGPVTSKDAYQINFDLSEITRIQAEYVVKRLNGKGNVIIMRGVAGTEADKQLHEGYTKVFEKYPDIKVVATVNADWTNTVAQTKIAAILPSLPNVDAVVGQGGDDYGAIQAFEAAGKPVPLVTGGNRGNFLTWWSEQNKKNGYTTISVAANPWVATAGLHVAMDILNGKKVPKVMIMPSFTVTQDDLPKYANLEATAVASPKYDKAWVEANLVNQTGGSQK